MKRLLCNRRGATRAGWICVLRLFVLLAGLECAAAWPQERFLLEGIVDAEAYKTDGRSYFLARNDGDISGLGRLQLWSAWQVSSSLQLYALGEFEVENASGKTETDSELHQFALRYSSQSSPFYFIEFGQILTPFAVASERRQSSNNPLIGQPNFLYAPYPIGIQVAGSSGWFDYRAALVDGPAIDSEYLPGHPGSAFRPDLGIGVSPHAGLRFGLAYSRGPYLSSKLEEFLPPGSDWKDFDQELWGLEVQFSRGYLELNGEVAVAEYEVPFEGTSGRLASYFLETKYAWSPRWYGALRMERTEYPLIRHLRDLTWLSANETVYDLEIGLAYRFSADTQLKISFRTDHWKVAPQFSYYYPDGHSLALQLSHHFDLKSLFSRDR